MSLILTKFPVEFLYLVSDHLTYKDWRQCVRVCRLWHSVFKSIAFQKVNLHSEEHLEKFMYALNQSYQNKETYHFGYSVKEISIVVETNALSILMNDGAIEKPITLSQSHFEALISLCPNLEVLDFDPSQWSNFEMKTTSESLVWHRMRRLPPISYLNFTSNFLSPFSGGTRLTHLHLKYFLHKLPQLIDKLSIVPLLQHLTLEEEDEENTIQVLTPSQYLTRIHQTLPHLESLHLKRNRTPHLEILTYPPQHLSPLTVPNTIRKLTLEGHIDCIRWFNFVPDSYPHLQQLELTRFSYSQFGTKWKWQQALIQLIQRLPYLRQLKIGGKNTPQLFSDSLADALKDIQEFWVDFETYQPIESCQFLMLARDLYPLRGLRLRVWEQMPTWTGIVSNLYPCQQLVNLELSMSKSMNDQFPYTPILIDRLLLQLPKLENLTLLGAHIHVLFRDIENLEKRPFPLKRLLLRQSKIENHKTVLRYLSSCCYQLKSIAMYMCELSVKEKVYFRQSAVMSKCFVPFDMEYSALEQLVLSTSMLDPDRTHNHDYVGVEVVVGDEERKKIVWYSVVKNILTRQSLSIVNYKLCEDEEQTNELNEFYQLYRNSSDNHLSHMPGLYMPILSVITIQTKRVLPTIYLDNMKISSKLFR